VAPQTQSRRGPANQALRATDCRRGPSHRSHSVGCTNWQGKSIKFDSLKGVQTLSLYGLYEILKTTPEKKEQDKHPDLSTDVISIAVEPVEELIAIQPQSYLCSFINLQVDEMWSIIKCLYSDAPDKEEGYSFHTLYTSCQISSPIFITSS